MIDSQIEQEIQDKGLTAPRVTPADIEANICTEFYFTAHDGAFGANAKECDASTCVADVFWPRKPALEILTFCVLVLKNGFTVTGESACVNPENFDAGLGKKIAKQNAINKLWPLLGYALKEKIFLNAI